MAKKGGKKVCTVLNFLVYVGRTLVCLVEWKSLFLVDTDTCVFHVITCSTGLLND